MNWMRWNSTPSASAKVFTARVLARPGHALDEKVAAGHERDHHPLEQVVLAHDDPLDVVKQRPRATCTSGSPGPPAGRRSFGRGAGGLAGGGDGHGEPDAGKVVGPAGLARPITIPTT